MDETQEDHALGFAERDLVALGIAVASILLFVATGSKVLPEVVRSLLGEGQAPDLVLVNALLLNIALVIFGWRRYRQLTDEITDRRRAELTAKLLAETDPLTGCLNRRSVAKATEEMRVNANIRGEAVAFVVIDLDNFKQVNDMNGHAVGDAVLIEMTRRLKSRLPQDAVIARIGGDEFAFVVPFNPKHPERIDDIAIRLIESSAHPMQVDGTSVDISLSIGIASDLEQDQSAETITDAAALIHRADIAMYQAKKQGKSRHFWFEPSMENELRYRNQLEIGIRRGVENGEFVPYYEQQVDLGTGDLIGFEMLARWHSPNMGVVSPEVFIPVAEEIGVIAQLSEDLMAQAFNDAKAWDPNLTLSINISPVQLRDPWFSQKLLKLMVKHNFPPSRLEIEITESCLHENVGMVRSMISSLRNQGVQVSLDDFGTGYSSLEQLRTLPFDRLKIDRSFISELGDAGANTKIVNAIIALCEGLDLPITAEGIEDGEILDALKQMGSLKGQGYHYGRPETNAQVVARLASAGRLVTHENQGDPAPVEADAPAKAAES